MISFFYGTMLLAFENISERILKGNRDNILNNVSVFDNNSNTFQLFNDAKTYLLRPLYDIEEQSYGVYAAIRNY